MERYSDYSVLDLLDMANGLKSVIRSDAEKSETEMNRLKGEYLAMRTELKRRKVNPDIDMEEANWRYSEFNF